MTLDEKKTMLAGVMRLRGFSEAFAGWTAGNAVEENIDGLCQLVEAEIVREIRLAWRQCHEERLALPSQRLLDALGALDKLDCGGM